MIRRLAALTVLAFSFALVSYSGMVATGQEKDTPKGKATSKATSKGTSKGTKKAKAPEKTEKGAE